MKFTFIAAIAGLTLAASGASWAGGNHAGGHGDGEQAIGRPGVAADATRTMTVDMNDTMRFSPAHIEVRPGDTVRFIVKNSGKVRHEMVLGTETALKAHYEAMKKNPEMEHADANMVTLQPGQTGEVIWQFTQAGKVDFACLQPGHYDAGMKGVVIVAAPDMTEGVVRKVDNDNHKITLKHGDIRNLDMPGMTMVFQVKDPAMLDRVKVGDKVKFAAEKINGAIVVTELEQAR